MQEMACPACFTPGPSPLLVNLSLETPANPQHVRGLGYLLQQGRSPAWQLRVPGEHSGVQPGPLGCRRGFWEPGSTSFIDPHLCTDLSSGFPGWCAGPGTSITPITPVAGRE